ncbi:beta-Ala-His dipeptidase [Paxillus involutus ATCC 200175]|uniref:Beta-Ala-His dipeptidase n=1 Tax=Paxillus involutus ATCC 200175 TaxID=664439 RepID=A0A0C9T4E2_PAXIN|nr:beta-Ala-His dipeptidase [Paxillus involutus ATCC 200175]
MSGSDQVSKFYAYVDSHQEDFVQRLVHAVGYRSISSDQTKEGRNQVIEMGHWLRDQLAQFVVKPEDAELVELVIPDKTDLNLPPLVLARIGEDLQKKTVLVYGHYDVQPVGGWEAANPDNPNAFKLGTTDKEKLIGRGATDDKGPIMGWLNVLEAHKSIADDLGKPLAEILPVNIRFLFEGMEESSSVGLEKWINEEVKKTDKGWFKRVDCVCITDVYWLTTHRPSLTYGLRGIAFFSIDIEGATTDLHSGSFGRMVHEPMTDLVKLFSVLVETNGVIFKEVEEMVPEPTPAERKEYEDLKYEVSDLLQDIGNPVELDGKGVDLIMGRMRYPSLSIHGIKGAFDTITAAIPHNISGRFSIRLVGEQTPQKVFDIVDKFLRKEFDNLKSKNKMSLALETSGMPWVGNKDHWNFQAAHAAIQAVHDVAPVYARDGGSIPIVLTLEQALGGKNVLLLSMGKSDDGAHSLHEKLDRDNYFKGTKVYGTYLYELAKQDAS